MQTTIFKIIELIELSFFSLLFFLVACLWVAVLSSAIYLVLKLTFGKRVAKSESEPGLAPKKSKKVAADVQPSQVEPTFGFDDAEEMEAIARRKDASEEAAKSKASHSSALADRLADEFEGQTVTA